jgi:hypothetical protein
VRVTHIQLLTILRLSNLLVRRSPLFKKKDGFRSEAEKNIKNLAAVSEYLKRKGHRLRNKLIIT